MFQQDIITRPKAVLFDLDNTLYSYQPAHEAGCEAAREKLKFELGISAKDFDTAFSAARNEIKNRLGNTASSHSRLLYFQRMIELLGLRTQVLLSLDLEQTYWRNYLGKANLFEGVREFLEELELLDIPRVVVTDLTVQIQFRKLVYFGIDQLIDFVVSSEEVGIDKPHYSVFGLALSKAGIKEGPVWMIGDNLETDILGAEQAIKAVTFLRVEGGKGLFGTADSVAAAVFKEFGEMLRILRKAVIDDKDKEKMLKRVSGE